MNNYTVTNFSRDFPDDGACLDWIREHRWPVGIRCRKCQEVTRHHRLRKRNCWECDRCGTQVYPTAGTIFHKSTTPLRSWFYAIYQIVSTRGAISARELQRQLGVTYKTAWRMRRSILREAVTARLQKVEVAEVDTAGKRRVKRPGAEVHTTVLGAVQPEGIANTQIPGRKRWITRSDFEAVLKAATTPIGDNDA